jgi:alpha-galactosidase
MPPRPKGKEMYTIAGRVVEEPGEWILREVDIAAEMGAEAFMVNAGWYGATFGSWVDLRGDWEVGTWMPGGLAGVREYAKKKGLLFGLWHEAETVSDKAELKKKHPEWLLTTDKGRQVAEGLDLANPEAAKFLEESVIRIVREHKLDFYKLDYNISPAEGGQTVADGYAESEYWRHFEVLNRAYDRVLTEFPDVCLENCASGGGRNDLAMLSRFHYASQSDWSVMPFSIRAINAMTLFVPPEALCYYHNHVNWMGVQAHQLADADTHLRVTLFALPIFVGFGGQDADRSTEFFRKTKRYIELNKGFCRPVMANHPRVFHHTPDIGLYAPADWCVLEYAMADRSRGYAGLFKLSPEKDDCCVFRARGVDLGAQYRVTLDNSQQTFTMSGRELGLQGIPVTLDSALTSELVLYQQEDTNR